MNNVENLTTAFARLVTLGTTVWTELTYSTLYKVPGRAVLHTGVFETQVVFLTAQTIIGFPLTRSTPHGTAVTPIGLWVTSARMPHYTTSDLKSMIMCGCVPDSSYTSTYTSLVMGTYCMVLYILLNMKTAEVLWY